VSCAPPDGAVSRGRVRRCSCARLVHPFVTPCQPFFSLSARLRGLPVPAQARERAGAGGAGGQRAPAAHDHGGRAADRLLRRVAGGVPAEEGAWEGTGWEGVVGTPGHECRPTPPGRSRGLTVCVYVCACVCACACVARACQVHIVDREVLVLSHAEEERGHGAGGEATAEVGPGG
jgi:hypothetical protein